MICQRCKKSASTIRFTEVVDGQVIERNLCSECLSQIRREASGFSVNVPKPMRRVQSREPEPRDAAAQRHCEHCGTSLHHITETSSVGCASCYAAFGREIEAILEALHRGVAHRGKSLQSSGERLQRVEALQAKRALLRSVLKEENYEEAARLRDEIARIENAAPGGGLGLLSS